MFQRAPPGHYSSACAPTRPCPASSRFRLAHQRRSDSIAVVLMDLSMPILSGFGSVELIRAFEQERQAHDPAYPRAPIFALTVRRLPHLAAAAADD
jgi:CheY-like chemotaxis protein